MNHKILTMLLGLGATAAAVAAPVTPEAALQRARGNAPARAAAMTSPMTLVKTITADRTATLYIFEGKSGFIVTPADDAAPAVLGYGDAKTMDADGEMAPGFQYWMEFLSSRMETLAEGLGTVREGTGGQDFDVIAPLCTTTWNQGSPYNDECPIVDGSRSVTGCVATAMSQVMKYHNWPPEGEGSLSYSYEKNGNEYTVSTNFADYSFDWESMLDNYDNGGTTAQRKAVAHLMRAAGGSVNMTYSPQESGAVSNLIGMALGTYFSYDKSLTYERRDLYPLYTWEEMIYNSLKTYGPVVYDGQSDNGGHSFVCDGYAGEGYFHINWGWGGMSDGNFLLDFLDPMDQGIGGAGSGYNFKYMQDAVLGIRPDRQGTSQWPEGSAFLVAGYGLGVEGSYAPGEEYHIDGSAYNGTMFTMQNESILYERYMPVPEGDPVDIGIFYIPELDPGWGFSDFGNFTVSGQLPDGRYKMVLITQEPEADHAMAIKIPVSMPQFMYCEAREGTQTFTKVEVVAPNVESITLPASASLDAVNIDVPMTLRRQGSGAFESKVRFELYDGTTLAAYGDEKNVKVEYGTPASVEYATTRLNAASGTLEAKEYSACMSYQIAAGGPYVPLCDLQPFTLTMVSGIEGIEGVDASEAVAVDYFDLQGRRLDEAPSAPGVYLRVCGSNVEKIMK